MPAQQQHTGAGAEQCMARHLPAPLQELSKGTQEKPAPSIPPGHSGRSLNRGEGRKRASEIAGILLSPSALPAVANVGPPQAQT